MLQKKAERNENKFHTNSYFFLSTIIPVERRNMKIGSAIELSNTCKQQQGFQSLLTNTYS